MTWDQTIVIVLIGMIADLTGVVVYWVTFGDFRN